MAKAECVPDTRSSKVETPKKPKKAHTTQSGSGFFVNGDGWIVTNHHVVKGCDKILYEFQRRTYSGVVKHFNSKFDLAAIKTSLRSPHYASFYDSLEVKSGTKIVVVGYPLRGLLASEPHVSVGTVTAGKGILNNPFHFQISAPIQAGNSGGPVLDLNGNVIGVTLATIDTIAVAEAIGSIPQNVNFAVHGEVLSRFLSSINVTHARKGEIWSAASAFFDTEEDVADEAKRFTVTIECRPVR